MNAQKNILRYTLLPLLTLFIAASYYRFVVTQDYLVSYEGDCDPYTQSCYLYCEDEECSEPFYYSLIERKANEVNKLCGPDITDCEAASECSENVEICTITFCDPTTEPEACESLDQLSLPPDQIEEEGSLTEEVLQELFDAASDSESEETLNENTL